MGRLILFILGLILVTLGAADFFIGISLPQIISWILLAYWAIGALFLMGDMFLLCISWGQNEKEIAHLENEMMLPKEAPRAFFVVFFGLLTLVVGCFGLLEGLLGIGEDTQRS